MFEPGSVHKLHLVFEYFIKRFFETIEPTFSVIPRGMISNHFYPFNTA